MIDEPIPGEKSCLSVKSASRERARVRKRQGCVIALMAMALFFSASPGADAKAPPAVRGPNGMVVSAQHLASEVGNSVLEQGGNAIDAAVATAYALAVVYPCCGNIGGGGFATIRLGNGVEKFIDFRERAPLAATRDMYLDARGNPVPELSQFGYKAVGVPGIVAGLDWVLTHYGTMDRQTVMAPAIELAKNGFVLRQSDTDYFAAKAQLLLKQDNVSAIFYQDGKPWPAGHRLVQRDLAATLNAIAEDGPDALYKGPIAKAIVAASDANGGILSLEDFADYRVREFSPVRCRYRGYEIITAPPPSSGGTTICLILNILEGYPVRELGFHSSKGIHVLVEAMRHAYVDRNFLLGDPDFVDNPVEQLLSASYAASIRSKIVPGRAGRSQGMKATAFGAKGTETTHISVVDRDDNAVALTFSLNFFFGAGIIAGDTGFFLNDTMNDFTVKLGVPTAEGLVQGERNGIAPGKTPLSSMSPTIVTKDGKLVMALGSPGGPRIISIVTQAISNVIDHGMDIETAVVVPRMHHQWMPDVVYVEPLVLSADTRAALEAMGYTLTQQRPWGALQAIRIAEPGKSERTSPAIVQDTMVFSKAPAGTRLGASDPRRPTGAAIGH